MANDIPADYPAPDPALLLPEDAILEATVRDIPDACNWIHSQLHAGVVIHQNWSSGDQAFRWDDTEELACEWRIPPLPGRTSISLVVYGLSSAVGGGVRFTSVTAGDTETIPLGAVGWGVGTLAVDASAGYETIRLYITGTGGETEVRTVCALYLAVSSPIPQGMTGDFCPFDEDEFAADEPLSADAGRAILDNLDALDAYQQVYLNWSALSATVEAYAGTGESPMASWFHRVRVPVLHGTTDDELDLTVHTREANPGGSDEVIIVLHGREDGEGSGPHRTTITVGAGAALGWALTPATIRLPEEELVDELGHCWTSLGVYPGAGAFQSTAEVHGISVWGR